MIGKYPPNTKPSNVKNVNKEIFTKLIETAEENNWDLFCWKESGSYSGWKVSGDNQDNLKLNILIKQFNRIVPVSYSLYDVLFNIKFASSYFGTKRIQPNKNNGYELAWKIHLQRLVILDNKLDYFKNLLD